MIPSQIPTSLPSSSRRTPVRILGFAVSLCVYASCMLTAQGSPASAPPSEQSTPSKPASTSPDSAALTEDGLKQILLDKPLYLRNCYLDASLSFNENGVMTGHPQPGPYTLCGVQIEKIHLGKRKVELTGARYGLHFLGALPYEDPAKAMDRVRITPAKKQLRITIDRELVVKPKKIKNTLHKVDNRQLPGPAASSSASAAQQTPTTGQDVDKDPGAADSLHETLAEAPEAEKPADPNSITTTTSPAHAAQKMHDALAKIFAPGLDAQMISSMPAFWKLYYTAVAAKNDYRPKDPSIYRQDAVDHKARLISNFEPPSNQFAQDAGVAGMALYHVVIGADGKPGEIAVARPIGFGLDENAVEAIQGARFEPATKAGKPVPVLIDLVVQFRIFSNRTAARDSATPADKDTRQPQASAPEPPAAQPPTLPGPYSRP